MRAPKSLSISSAYLFSIYNIVYSTLRFVVSKPRSIYINNSQRFCQTSKPKVCQTELLDKADRRSKRKIQFVFTEDVKLGEWEVVWVCLISSSVYWHDF